MEEKFLLECLNNDQYFFSQELIEKLRNHQKKIILFGAGEAGHSTFNILMSSGIEPDFFCDNNPLRHGSVLSNKPILSFEELCNCHKDSYIIITTPKHCNEITLQLSKNGFSNVYKTMWKLTEQGFWEIVELYYYTVCHNKDNFSKVFNFLNDGVSKQVFYDFINYRNTWNREFLPLRSENTQYFDKEIIRLNDEEVFIDGGAFDGDTVEEFLKQTDRRFIKIFSFEPDEKKHSSFIRKHGENLNIQLYPYGLWDKQDVLHFKNNEKNSGGNRLTEFDDGNVDVPVIAIDDVLQGELVTFIKMDVEGAELQALKGAKESIKKYKPKLAICVYHKFMDIVDLPLYIKELVPEYKFYLRHYSDNQYETVLYAIP